MRTQIQNRSFTKIAILVLGLLSSKSQAQNIPLELKINNGNICMEWSAKQTTKTDMFIIERSNDGITFESIGIKEGTDDNTYTFCDNDLDGNRKFYRIMKVENKTGKMDFGFNEVEINPYSETQEFISSTDQKNIGLVKTNQLLTNK